MKLKRLLIVTMLMVFTMVFSACGNDGGSGSGSSKKNLSPEEEMAVGRWIGIDVMCGPLDLYSDGTGVYHVSISDGHQARYVEWEYDAEAGKYVVYEVKKAEEGDEHDENGMRVWIKDFEIKEITVSEEPDNIQGFVSVGNKAYVGNYAYVNRMVRTDMCDIDPFGYAAEDAPVRDYPDYKDGEMYGVPAKEGAKSVALYKELGIVEYKKTLTE